MNMSFLRDVGSYVACASGGVARAVAAGTGDATELSGPYYDRTGKRSCTAWLVYTTTLGATETLTISGNLQDATDSSGTGVADYGTAYAATVVATGPGGGGTVTGAVRLGDFDLSGANSHVSFQHTPNMSASSADLSTTAVVLVFSDSEKLPAS